MRGFIITGTSSGIGHELCKLLIENTDNKVIGIGRTQNIEHTNYHPLYGEAMNKTYLPPVRVHALIEWEGVQTAYTESMGIDKATSIVVHFHKRRLTEDQDLFVREGDFLLYGDIFYEIHTLGEPTRIFGQIDDRMEISAKCKRARKGVFDAT